MIIINNNNNNNNNNGSSQTLTWQWPHSRLCFKHLLVLTYLIFITTLCGSVVVVKQSCLLFDTPPFRGWRLSLVLLKGWTDFPLMSECSRNDVL